MRMVDENNQVLAENHLGDALRVQDPQPKKTLGSTSRL